MQLELDKGGFFGSGSPLGSQTGTDASDAMEDSQASDDDHAAFAKHVRDLNISMTGVRVLKPRVKQHRKHETGAYFYRPKAVSLTTGHFALSVRLAQIKSCEAQIEEVVRGVLFARVEAVVSRRAPRP